MSVIWKDGRFLDGTLPHVFHDDGGLVNGLAVFDSMLAIDGILVDALPHYERLIHDARIVLGISESWIPVFAQMTEAWLPLLTQNQLSKGHARVKTIVTGGISDKPLGVSDIPSVIVSVSKSGAPNNLPPLKCAVVKDFPRIAGSILENCKRTDYTRSLAARRAAAERGADDAIITNTDGLIACGSTSNIFIEERGVLITPPLIDGVLAGITRAKILTERKAREDHITEEQLYAADKIYLTNSFWGLRPVMLAN